MTTWDDFGNRYNYGLARDKQLTRNQDLNDFKFKYRKKSEQFISGGNINVKTLHEYMLLFNTTKKQPEYVSLPTLDADVITFSNEFRVYIFSESRIKGTHIFSAIVARPLGGRPGEELSDATKGGAIRKKRRMDLEFEYVINMQSVYKLKNEVKDKSRILQDFEELLRQATEKKRQNEGTILIDDNEKHVTAIEMFRKVTTLVNLFETEGREKLENMLSQVRSEVDDKVLQAITDEEGAIQRLKQQKDEIEIELTGLQERLYSETIKQQNLREAIESEQSELEQYQKEFESEKSRVGEEIIDVQQKIGLLSAQEKALEESIDRLKNDEQSIKEKMQKAEQIRITDEGAIEELKQQKNALQFELSGLQDMLTKQKELQEAIQSEKSQLEQYQKEFETEKSRLGQERLDVKQQLSQLEAQQKALEESISKLKTDEKSMNEKMQKAEKIRKSEESKATQIRQNLLAERKKHADTIAFQEQTKGELESNNQKLQSEGTQLKNEIANLEKNKLEMNRIQTALAEGKKTLQGVTVQIQTKKNELEKFDQDISDKKIELSKMGDPVQVRKYLEGLKLEIEKLEQTKPQIEEDTFRCQTKLQELKIQETSYQKRIDSLKETLEGYQSDIDRKTTTLEALVKEKEKIFEQKDRVIKELDDIKEKLSVETNEDIENAIKIIQTTVSNILRMKTSALDVQTVEKMALQLSESYRKKLDDSAYLESKIQTFNEQVKTIKAQYEETKNSLEEDTRRLTSLKDAALLEMNSKTLLLDEKLKELSVNGALLDSVVKKLKEIRESLSIGIDEDITKELNALEDDVSRLTGIKKEILTLENVKTLMSDLKDSYQMELKISEALKSDIANLTKVLNEQKGNQQSNEETKRTLEKDIKDLKNRKKTLASEVSSNAEKLEKKLEELESNVALLKSAEQQLANIRENLNIDIDKDITKELNALEDNVSRLTGIKKESLTLENLKKLIQGMTESGHRKRKDLSSKIKQSEKQLKAQEEKKKTLDSEINSLSKKKDDLDEYIRSETLKFKEELSALKEDMASYEQVKPKLENIRKSLSIGDNQNIKQALDEFEERISTLTEIQKENLKLETIRSLGKSLQKNNDEYRTRKVELENQIAILSSDTDVKKDNIKKLEQQLTELNQKLDTTREEIARRESEIVTQNEQIQRLEALRDSLKTELIDLKGQTTTANKEIERLENSKKEYQDNIDQLQSQYESSQEGLQLLKENLRAKAQMLVQTTDELMLKKQEFETKAMETATIEAKLIGLQTQLNQLTTQVQLKTEEVILLRNEIDTMNETKVERAKEIEEKVNQLAELGKDLEIIKKYVRDAAEAYRTEVEAGKYKVENTPKKIAEIFEPIVKANIPQVTVQKGYFTVAIFFMGKPWYNYLFPAGNDLIKSKKELMMLFAINELRPNEESPGSSLLITDTALNRSIKFYPMELRPEKDKKDLEAILKTEWWYYLPMNYEDCGEGINLL